MSKNLLLQVATNMYFLLQYLSIPYIYLIPLRTVMLDKSACLIQPSNTTNAESWLQDVLCKFNRTTCFGQTFDHHQVHKS